MSWTVVRRPPSNTSSIRPAPTCSRGRASPPARRSRPASRHSARSRSCRPRPGIRRSRPPPRRGSRRIPRGRWPRSGGGRRRGRGPGRRRRPGSLARVEDLDRRAAEELAAARHADRVDGRREATEIQQPGVGPGAGRAVERRAEALRRLHGVGHEGAGDEAHAGDPVVAAGVGLDHLGDRHVVEFGDVFDVVADPEGLGALARPGVVVERGDDDAPARQRRHRALGRDQRLHVGDDARARGRQRVEDEAEGAHLRVGLDQPLRRVLAQREVERQDAEVERDAGFVAELDVDRGIAQRPEHRLVVDHAAPAVRRPAIMVTWPARSNCGRQRGGGGCCTYRHVNSC